MVPACPNRRLPGNGQIITTITTATTVADFEAPRYVEFLHAPPLNATVKVVKERLK
jgi:hypothetical protein